MAKLTQAERDSLPNSAFADPVNRTYPIHDEGHCKSAIGHAHHHDNPELIKAKAMAKCKAIAAQKAAAAKSAAAKGSIAA